MRFAVTYNVEAVCADLLPVVDASLWELVEEKQETLASGGSCHQRIWRAILSKQQMCSFVRCQCLIMVNTSEVGVTQRDGRAQRMSLDCCFEGYRSGVYQCACVGPILDIPLKSGLSGRPHSEERLKLVMLAAFG